MLLRSLTVQRPSGVDLTAFPYSLPVIQAAPQIDFAPVTFFVGENGSGKSTLMEGLACAAGSVTAGSDPADRDTTLDHVRPLVPALKLVWNQRTRKGFFLRAEDYFGYVRRMKQTRQELQRELEETSDEMKGRSLLAQNLARMPYARELRALDETYAGDLDARSHGESFFTFFQRRIVPKGLYLLDEPEAALSPVRQLALITLIKQAVAAGSQFIVATHSPMLMAYPDALILSFDETPPRPIAYDEADHVALIRDFLRDPQAYLRRL